MHMKLGLGVKLGTSLSLTPQLQQAIRLLQLSSLELEQEIQLQLDNNPLLEREDDEDALSNLQEKNDNNPADTHSPDVYEQMATNTLDEIPVDTNWDDIYIHQPTTFDRPEMAENNNDYLNQTQSSVQDHVRWQMNFKHLTPIDALIAERLIDAMDERGYIGENLVAMCEQLNTELVFNGLGHEEDLGIAELTVVLKLIQSCEPAGVGARDLAECLLLQLKQVPRETPYLAEARCLLQHHTLLLQNDLARLLKATQLTAETLQHSLSLIRTLEPYPGLQYQPIDNSYQAPDVLVELRKDTQQHSYWQVRLNPDIMPKLRINQEYANLIKRNDTSETNQYLKEHLNDAKHFIKGVDERNKSLLKVATCIVQKQQAFFEQGETAMRPLILREVAEEVDLHESTVSRITTSKTMLTPRGMYELKYFFSSHVTAVDGEECSSTAVCAMIKTLIEAENPKKPLSDNAIATTLHKQGIDVARRTVAKYRESLGIASSTQRKRLF